MAFPKRSRPVIEAEVSSNPEIMGGWPCLRGTRVPAMTIVAELRAGTSAFEIFSHYPSIPLDGIDAVRRWAIESGVSLEPQPDDVV